MEKRRLFFWQLGALAFVWVAGTVAHFIYEWSGQALWAGLFFSVNESVWEHLKLVFFPSLFFLCIEYAKFSRRYPAFLAGKTVGILAGMLLIVVGYYTYTGVWGVQVPWANILLFFLAVLLSESLAWLLIPQEGLAAHWMTPLAAAVLLIVAVGMMALSYVTPHIPLFLDPSTGLYGAPQGIQ